MASSPRVLITTDDFNLADEVAALRANDKRVGAVCSFIGTVRDRNDGLGVSSMELEHYPGMTEKAIEAMIDEAHQRFDIYAARVIHRVGLLQPLDQIVLVAVSSAHRGESFQACEFLMDYLKTQAPFWKKSRPLKAHAGWTRVSATTRPWPNGASGPATLKHPLYFGLVFSSELSWPGGTKAARASLSSPAVNNCNKSTNWVCCSLFRGAIRRW